MTQTIKILKPISRVKVLEEILSGFAVHQNHIDEVSRFLALRDDENRTPSDVSIWGQYDERLSLDVRIYIPKAKWFKSKEEFQDYITEHNLPSKKRIYFSSDEALCSNSECFGVQGSFYSR